jgi:hypothetical protein
MQLGDGKKRGGGGGRTKLLADQLRRELCAKEGKPEHGVSQVEVIRGETQVLEEVVGVGLANVASVKVQREKGDESPEGNFPVELVDQGLHFWVR